MTGQRTASMLGVLLLHALVVWALLEITRHPDPPRASREDFATQLLLIPSWQEAEPAGPVADRPEFLTAPALVLAPALPEEPASADPVGSPSPAATPEDEARNRVDWPLEARRTAERIVAEQLEAERVARLFAGPQGTWASLTQRQQSELRKFRWKPGVDGIERDERGNTILRVNERCVLVNFLFIGCALGAKPPAYGDLFKDMRQYFDEQRLPRTPEGNGREPESLRPPAWSRPLGEKDR